MIVVLDECELAAGSVALMLDLWSMRSTCGFCLGGIAMR